VLVAVCVVCQLLMYMDSGIVNQHHGPSVQVSSLPRTELAPAAAAASASQPPPSSQATYQAAPPPANEQSSPPPPPPPPPPSPPPPPPDEQVHEQGATAEAVTAETPPAAWARCGGTDTSDASAAGSTGCDSLPSLASLQAAAKSLRARGCEVLVATAVFEATRLLQTKHCGHKGSAQAERRRAQLSSSRRAPVCHVAFVDWQSERALKQFQEDDLVREGDDDTPFVGCWQLLTVRGGLPLRQPAANALLIKLLLPLLLRDGFANASLWIDATRPPPQQDLAALARSALRPAAAAAAAAQAAQAAPLLAVSLPAGDGGGAVSDADATPLRLSAWGGAGAGADAAASAELDTSLVVRSHHPAREVRQLACLWWRQWLRVASGASSGGAEVPAAEDDDGKKRNADGKDAKAAEREAARGAAAALRGLGGAAADAVSLVGLGLGASPKLTTPRSSLPPRPARAAWPHLPLATPHRCVAPPDAATLARPPPLRFAAGGAGLGFSGAASGLSDAARDGALALGTAQLSRLPCGCMAPHTSPFERAAQRVATGAAACDTVVLTSIFEGYDRLIQPSERCLAKLSAAERECFFAFVDRQSYDLLLYEGQPKGLVRRGGGGGGDGAAPPRVGVWQLLLLEGTMPYPSSPRRNSRVPKLLAHRLFAASGAKHALWLDSKLQLHLTPTSLAARFLRDGVVFAALRNFRRDHIFEERDWIWRHKCKEDVEACADLIRQWAAYVDEQPRPDWEASTSALEGCLLLQDLQAPLAQLIFCNWWNEYVRYGERDQLSLSYVLLRMGLTQEGGATAPAVRLLPRSMHYLQKPSARELHIVTKLGHRDGSRKVPPGISVAV